MHKAFISVAGEDVSKARQVTSEFVANQIYLYDESGKHAADMWQEEADALRASTVLVIFWSKNYLKKQGTLREIRLAAELLELRRLGRPLIVRLDDTPLNSVGDRQGDESDGVELLAPLIERWRALPLPFDKEVTSSQLERLLIENGTATPPEFDRSNILQKLNVLAQTTPREIKPIFWISGHEGYGRRFVVEKYMLQFDPNSKRIEIPLLDSDGPLQALLRLKGRSAGIKIEALERLVAASKDGHGGTDEAQLLVEAVEAISTKGGHVVITMEALNKDANRWIPNWLLSWMENVPAGRKPKVYIVAQFGFPQALLIRKDLARKVTSFMIPSLEFDEAKTFAYRLTGFFDLKAERWQPKDIERVADDAEGNISLLIAMSRNRSLAPDLNIYIGSASDVPETFITKLNRYLDGCMLQIRLVPDAIAMLRVFSDLQLVSFSDMKIMFPQADLHTVLGELLDLGLIEAPGEGLYRVPRLVVRRLDIHLNLRDALSSDTLVLQDRFKRLFAKSADTNAREPLIDKIETRVRAHLLTGAPVNDSPLAKFITASYLLQAGIRAYDRQDYSSSLKLLRDCVRHKNEFPEINTRCVMLRYFGLAAAREEKTVEIQQAVEHLIKEGKSGAWKRSRVNPEADAEFVLGFACRLSQRWTDACKHFLKALVRMEQDGSSRIGDCHRELAECYLHEQVPNYAEARSHATKAYESRDTIMTLDILVKALTASCWNDTKLTESERATLESKLDNYFDRLQALSTALGMGMWHQRKAEDLMQSGKYEDLVQALAYAKEALAISSRQDFHPLIWKILSQLGSDQHLDELVKVTKDAIGNQRLNARTRSVAARYLVAVYIQLHDFNNAQSTFDHYKSGFPAGVLQSIQTSIRARDIANATWLT
jgi:tetratricopeptide (TPR) repeat protein